MSEGVGIVERKTRKLSLPEGGLRLAYGGVLKEVEVAYEECGAPIGPDNVIYICHALTGDAHVAGIRPGEGGGYRHFILAPRPDARIGWCKASYRSRHGLVKSISLCWFHPIWKNGWHRLP